MTRRMMTKLLLSFLFAFVLLSVTVYASFAQTPTPTAAPTPNITSPSSLPSGSVDFVVRVPFFWTPAMAVVLAAWGLLLIYAAWRWVSGWSGV